MALLGATTTLALRRVPRMSLRLTTRPLASQAAGPSGVGPACFGSGLAGGMMGGLIGLGGGVVMVPMMTAFARMTQHQAVGTSSLAVAAVGLSSCASFGSAGAVEPHRERCLGWLRDGFGPFHLCNPCPCDFSMISIV